MRYFLFSPRTVVAALALAFILLPASARLEGLLSTDLDVPGAPPPGVQLPVVPQPQPVKKETPEPTSDKGKSFVKNIQEKERTTLESEIVEDISFVDNIQSKERTTLSEPVEGKGKSFTQSAFEKSRKKSNTAVNSHQATVSIDAVSDGSVSRSAIGEDDGLDMSPFGDVMMNPVNNGNTMSTGPSAKTVTNIGKVKVGGSDN